MIRLIRMLVICSVLVISTGCASPGPETEGIKIGELAPAGPRRTEGVPGQLLRATNMDVTTFELPAANIYALDDIWQILNTSQLTLNDPCSFQANGLRAAAGKATVFGTIIEMLKSAKAEKQSTTSVLIPNGQAEVLPIARLTRKTTLSYIARGGKVESAEIGPGIIGLQVYARQITGSQTGLSGGSRVARVQIVPVITTPTEGLGWELSARIKANDIRIYSAGFGLNMRPGDLVVLAPSRYSQDEKAAAGRFFTRAGSKPSVMVVLLLCTSIT